MCSKSKKFLELGAISLLSLAVAYGSRIEFCGIVWSHYTENYINPVSLRNFAVFVLTFAILYVLLEVMNRYRETISGWTLTSGKRRLTKGKFFLLIFSLLLIFWLPYLLSFAPASILGDSLDIFRQAWYQSYSDNIPILYTLLNQCFFDLGVFLGSVNRGLFIYACLQYLTLAFTCTSTVVWLYTHHTKIPVVSIVTLFYALFPAFPAYAITMWKDPIFSIGLLALSFILLNDKSTWYQFFLSTLVILFLRSNGLVVVAAIALLTLCSKKKKRYSVLCVLAIGLSLFTSNALWNHFDAERRSEEALGIPLQQIAYTVVYESDSLSDSELEDINRILPIENIRASYAPCLVDNIKWHENFNSDYVRNNTGEVLRLWLRLLPKHLGSYIKAYALETYGFWMPFVQSDYGYIDLYISENELGIHGLDLFEKLFGVSLKDQLASFKPYIGSGTLIWIAFVGCVLCILSSQTEKLWFYLPGILCWLSVMISTPVAFSLRYVFVLILLVPVYILLPFLPQQTKKAEYP